jgi:hypothetical protein
MLARILALALALSLPAAGAAAQSSVVLVVTDGVRWQELFHGADTTLMGRESGGVGDTARLRRDFRRETPAEARRALFPFLWRMIDAGEGRAYGDAAAGSPARVTNGLNFSYPGYNELLAGRADPRIDSNEHGPNPNVTVFEWLHNRPGFAGRVAAFGTWEAFGRIFNRDRAGFPVRAGWEPPVAEPLTPAQAQLNTLYRTTTRLWESVAYDSFLQAALLDHLRTQRPRALFVGYGETDEWAHSGRYDQYLRSARRVDQFIEELWTTLQALPEYRGTTTFVVTTDHGRGGGPAAWRDHGRDVPGAESFWVAVIGPGAAALPRAPRGPVTQSQVAATVAALLGEDFHAAVPGTAPPIGGARAPR